MKIKRLRAYLSLIVAVLFASALLTRCANIGSPEGGPTDTLPPNIVSMTPENFTTNMDTLTRKIYIEFDEFVQLKDQQKNFFTSPKMKNKPQLQLRGRGVVVTLRDTLEANTTYALNFGQAIQDNNESNPLYSMRYVFSTGETIDSMMISGYAEDSYKMDSVSGAFILFFPKDSVAMGDGYDSTMFKSTPAVIARAENNGIFLGQNLKPIPYYIYALDDTNSNLTYEPGTDRVGFLREMSNPAQMRDFAIWYDSLRKYVVAEPQLHFRMFMDKPFARQNMVEMKRPLQHQAILHFSGAYPKIDSLIFDSIPSDKIIVEPLTKGRDTLALWFDMPSDQIPDSLRGHIVYHKHDSVRQLKVVKEELKLYWRFIESKEQEQERKRLEREKKKAEENGEVWEEPEVENPFKITASESKEVNPELGITFDFDYPLNKIDSTRFEFTMLPLLSEEELKERNALPDSLRKEEVGEKQAFSFVRDTQNLRRWTFQAKKWSEEVGSRYSLKIPAEALANVAGEKNDSLEYNFVLLDPEDFATVIIKVKEDKAYKGSYVLELLDGGGSKVIEKKTGVTAGESIFRFVPAGEVSLRIIKDVNNNGEWDSGDLIKRIEPERAVVFTQEGKRQIATKVNWELEIDIDPAKLLAAETQEQLAARLEKQEQERLAEVLKDKAENLHKGEDHHHDH